MKAILFIEDYYMDYFEFSSNIFQKNGYFVFPPKEIIKDQKDLNAFLGKNIEITDYSKKRFEIFNNLKTKVFKFINDNELYRKLSLIVIDINLTSTKGEEMGLDFLSSFRMEFKAKNSQYKDWSKIIPVIALSVHDKSKYENEFISYPGYLLNFFNKDKVRNKPDSMIKRINNLHDQMSAIYPLFFDPELKKILRKVSEHEKYLKEIKQISKLILFAEIAQMPAKKRNAFAESFTKDLIEYCKENDAFMVKVEDIEDSFSEKLKAFLNYPEVQAFGFITGLISFLNGFIKPESIPEVLDFITLFVSQ